MVKEAHKLGEDLGDEVKEALKKTPLG